MKSKIMRRTLMMAGLALAMIGASALPAAAVDTPLNFTTSGGVPGSIVINGQTIPIPGSGAGACDTPGTSNISPDVDASGNVSLLTTDWALTAGTINISGVDRRVQIFGHANTTGTISGSTASIGINVRAVVSNCNGVGTLCTINNVATPAGSPLVGTFSGSLPPVTGDTVTGLAGSSAAIGSTNFAIGCNSVIRAFFLGQSAAINVHLVRA